MKNTCIRLLLIVIAMVSLTLNGCENGPNNPSGASSASYSLVKDSDDFSNYKDAFAKAASQLIASGKCTADDFKEIGGWLKSTTHKSKPIYFTYCGGMHIRNRIYLDAVTGEITR